MVNVLMAPDTGVLCWIDLMVKTGTCTRNGSAPCATPCKAAPDLGIAVGGMEPTAWLFPSSIAADMLTDGDNWSDAAFFTVKVTVQDKPAANPPACDESISCPKFCVHEPVVPRMCDVEVIPRIAVLAV